ncbi:MAG: hypothetical protein AAF645_19400 [Myxococcota bacterium]
MLRLLLGLSVLVAALPSAAQEADSAARATDDEARARFVAGRALVETGEYRAARDEFQRGYVLSRRALFLFNMAECSRRLEEADRARREYAEYIRRDRGSERVPVAQQRLFELGPGDRSTPEWVAELDAPSIRVDEPPESAETNEPDPPIVTTDPSDSSAAVDDEGRPWYAHWALWTSVGAAVVTGVVLGVVLSSGGGPSCRASDRCFRQEQDLMPGPRL